MTAGALSRRFYVLTIAGLLALLGAGEGLLAVLLAHPRNLGRSGWLLEGLRNVYYREDWSVPQADLGIVRHDAELTYLLRPGPARFANRGFETTIAANSAGLRDDEASLHGPDLIVLGDSFAMGWGVAQHEAFPQILEKSTGLRVLNAGVSSFGTARETLLLERLDRSRARAVVVQYFLNDYAENRAYIDGGFELEIASAEELERAARRWQARLRYRPLDYLRAFFRPVDYTTFDPVLATVSEAEAARAALDVLDDSDALAGLPVFFLETDPWGEPVFNVSDEVRALLDTGDYPDLRDRFTLVRLAGLLAGAGEDHFVLDSHPNARGHARIATELERTLRVAGLLEESGLRPGPGDPSP